MTSKYLTGNPKWNEEEKAVESSGNTRFAKIRLYYPLYINRFVSGEFFSLPGVFYDEYNEDTKTSTRIGPKEFRGMTLAEKVTKYYMALVVLEMKNQHDQWYQRQIQFGNWKDKDDTGCAWLDFQKAEMEKLSPTLRDTLIQAAKDEKWAFVQYTEAETEYTGQYEIKKYLTDITVFKNEKEWQEAEKTFRSQFSDNSTGGLVGSIYPSGWANALEETIEWARGLKLGPAELAKKLDLANVKTSDGTPVNIPLVVSEILDLPLEMVQEALEEKLPF